MKKSRHPADTLLEQILHARLLTGFLLSCCLLLVACGRSPVTSQQAFVFGTQVEVVVAEDRGDADEKAIAAVLQEFDRLHRQYHAWEDSELTALNMAIADNKTFTASAELAEFLQEAKVLSAKGNYLFDPGIGKLIALWGFQSDEFKAELPPKDKITDWLAQKPSIADLQIHGVEISSRNRSVALDFGGYLKGVALDKAAALLKKAGIKNALINIGGNVLAMGNKWGRAWRIGIQHPRAPGPFAVLDLHDGEAIGTSGDYQRFFEVDGKRYAHLLDPRTGYPANASEAVSIVIPASDKAGTLSDALSKPLFIAGNQWREIAAEEGLTQVLRIDSQGHVEVSRALADRLKFIQKPADLTVVDIPAQKSAP